MSSPALLRFPSDVPFRRQLQPPGARRHPGKLHLGFLAYLLTAHAPRGGRLLDPFAGSGGLLLATLLPWGCDVLLNELEPQWVAQCEAAWAYLQASPAAPRGTAQIVHGDARALQAGGWDGLITSPPYFSQVGIPLDMGMHIPSTGVGEYIAAKRNGYRPGYDAVVTSPPYGDALGPGQVGQGLQAYIATQTPGRQGALLAGHNYDTSAALLRVEPTYDALLTSPPYQDAVAWQRHPEGDAAVSGQANATRAGYGVRNPAQIGNLAGARYWAAMAAVWAACVPLVRPGGVLVVVLKNIVRGNQEVDLIGGTRAQLEALGCRYVTTHYRAVAPGPFHRIRAKSRPDALIIDREGALVMEVP